MRIIRWLLVSVVLILALVIAGGWFWLNSYVQSDAFRRDVEARLSATLGGPVQIEQVKMNLLKGVQLKNVQVTLPNPVNGPAGQLITAQEVDCAYAFSALLQRKLELTRVTIRQPQVTLAGTNFHLNPSPASPTPPPDQPANPGPNQPRAESNASGLSFQFQVDAFSIKNGALILKDVGGSQGMLQGIDVDMDRMSPPEGNLEIESAELGHFKFTKIASPIVVAGDGGLQLSPFVAIAFAGNLTGSYRAGSGLQLNARGCDLSQILNALSSSASVHGLVDVQSKWENVESGMLQGEGDAQLRDGQAANLPLLNQIAPLLGLKFGANLPLTGASHFSIKNQVITLTGLQANSDLFHVNGGGTIDFNQQLHLDLVLVLDKTAMQQLRKEVAASFVQQQNGSGSISFTVTGTANNPQTDLPERLLLQNTKIQNLLQKGLNKLFKL